LYPSEEVSPKRLTFEDQQIHGLSWTADGREILFSTNHNQSESGTLSRVAAVGGVPEPVVGFAENVSCPSASRQGNRLSYTQWALDWDIWRVGGINSDPKSNRPVKLIATTRNDSAPQYSPDGKRIAFCSERSGGYEFWICDSEGHGAYQLSSHGMTGSYRWSPDGQRIAFDSTTQGHVRIYVMSTEGGAPRQLTMDDSDNVRPSWSHDGEWIYFGSNRGGDWEVWKIPSAGGPAVQVTKKGGNVALESPDGMFLYYSKLDSPGLWRIPVEGGEEVLIIETLETNLNGYWDVVDKGIYFVESVLDRSTSAPPAVLRFLSFANGRIKEVTSLEKRPMLNNQGLSASPDGRWVLYQDWEPQGGDIMLVENFK
jgi:dipeptidyl aminopeptidase/acylaminoacyl peptidase